jgi:hypothetical protein
MNPTIHLKPALAALLAAATVVALAAPVAAGAPVRETISETSIHCADVTAPGGRIRVVAGTDSLGGAGGLLHYWAPGSDPTTSPPTLVSGGVTVTVGADGSIIATFDLFIPGDLGLSEAGEPIFVGTAELVVSTEAGDPTRIDRRVQVGNTVFLVRGISQELTITAGGVDVPTVGTFDLAGGECAGTRKVESTFATQPDAVIGSRELIEVGCFLETSTGFVFLDAQAGVTETFVTLIVLDGDALLFGQAVDPELSLRGLEATLALPLDGDPSVVGTASIDARFEVTDRTKVRALTPDGWESETVYDLAVEGVIAVEVAGRSLELPMDGCSAGAQIGISKAG